MLIPEIVSGISKNHCPVYARTAVRNEQEPLSDLRKNYCPESARITVRFIQEYAATVAEQA